jgi:hypothetical protein
MQTIAAKSDAGTCWSAALSLVVQTTGAWLKFGGNAASKPRPPAPVVTVNLPAWGGVSSAVQVALPARLGSLTSV